MAPPSRRRIGHSKRAQYGMFAGYVAATLGALVGGILLLVSLFQPTAFAGLRGVASDVVAPAGEVGATARTGSESFVDSIAGYFEAGSQNAELRAELDEARVRLAEAKDLARENARLRALVEIPEEEQEPVARSRLIGATSSSTRSFAYIGVGSSDGVKPGMPVRSPLGLIGRVLETGRNSARIMLLSDTESRIPVRHAGSEVVAFAEGNGDGSLRIRLINLGINPLKQGDVFITSGAGGLFRPGVAVGVVRQVTHDGAVASMLSNPAGTDYVLIDPIWNPQLRDASQSGQLPDANAPPAAPGP